MAETYRDCQSLWRVATAVSRIECTLSPLSAGSCELCLSQDREVLLREQFASPEAARTYAAKLHDQVSRLARLTPRHVMHRAS